MSPRPAVCASARSDLDVAREMYAEASSADRDVVRVEIDRLRAAIDQLESEIRLLLLPHGSRTTTRT